MIKNLLFDLGGVIMDIDRDRCVEAFRELGMERPEELLDPYCQRGPFLSIEDGSATPAEFRDEIRRHMSRHVDDEEIDTAFGRFLKGIPATRLRQLERLRGSYGVYLISNTNPIMWEGPIARYFMVDGGELEHYFDGVVTSFEARCVKPERGIFELAVERFGIEPAETLFFDDSEANIKAAEAMGFHGMLVRPSEEFFDLMIQP